MELAFIGAVLGKNHYFGLRVKCHNFCPILNRQITCMQNDSSVIYTDAHELYCNKWGVMGGEYIYIYIYIYISCMHNKSFSEGGECFQGKHHAEGKEG